MLAYFSDSAELAINKDNSFKSDYTVNTDSIFKKLNSDMNWRVCLRIIVTRSLFEHYAKIFIANPLAGMRNKIDLEIYLNSTNSDVPLKLAFNKSYTFTG